MFKFSEIFLNMMGVPSGVSHPFPYNYAAGRYVSVIDDNLIFWDYLPFLYPNFDSPCIYIYENDFIDSGYYDLSVNDLELFYLIIHERTGLRVPALRGLYSDLECDFDA